MSNWQPIETAPKDGTTFIAKIGGAIYGAYYEGGNFCWIAHDNVAPGRSYKKVIIDGIEYQQELRAEAAPDYRPTAHVWIAGFEDKPTHWAALPEWPENDK